MKILLLALLVNLATGLFSQNVSVSMKMPSQATAGVEFEISIRINKGDVSGFARLQVDFPDGFTVRGGKTEGATFSYKDNKARFLWMSLPADEILNVSCMVTGGNVAGSQMIEGSFSYVFENETQRYTIIPQNINFGGASSVVAQITEEDNISQQDDSERLEREREERLQRERAEHDRQAKLAAERAAAAEAERLANQYAQSQTTTSTAKTETTTQTITSTPEKQTTSAASTQNKGQTSGKTTSSSSFASSSSASGIEYRVQIGAFRNSPNTDYFRNLESSISEHKISYTNDGDGFMRYTIGSFRSFNEANSFMSRVQQLGYTSFIVAFQDGRKISVTQARKITQN